MEYHGKDYVAAVLFDDAVFCRQAGELMKKYCGRAIEEIGGIDVNELL